MSEELTEYEKELGLEQEHVNQVTSLLRQEIIRLEPEVGELRSQVVDIRTHFWDDVSINLSNPDDKIETYASMRQQAEVLTEREMSHLYRVNRLNGMKRLLPAPYFGRIDFHEDDTNESEPFYIGLSSFMNEDNGTFYVYDWRTPIASLYYDYPPGPAKYDTPSGVIAGTLDLKRQYMIRDGSIQTMFDTGVTIGDELLQKALGRSADSQMKSIVATIQKEQNRIIRNVNSRMLIVQGAAGSGKTSAALQRVAYLLYRYRGFLKADQIVLFSPNPMFNSYVASVLPELGEENMQQTTFHEFLEYSLGAIFKLEGPFEQMEYVLTAEKNTGFEARLEGIRYKASGAFLQAIHNYKVHLEHEGMIFRDLIFQNRILISSEQIKRHFYSFEPSIRLSNRMELLKDWLVKEVVKLEIAERQADWVQDELDYLDKDQYQKAYVKSRSQQEDNEYSFDDAELEEDILRQMVVKEHFKPLRRFLRELKFADVIALYRQMFENVELFQKLASDGLADGIHLPELWEDIVSQTIAKLNEKELFHEDSTPFLYLKELVEGFQTNTQVRHVLLDEAQDYSPFQFEFLKRLFPRARMTVLGDFNQAIFTHSTSLIDNSPIAQLYGEAETERIILTQSYRSTHEIVEFTRGMLADGANILPFNRHGDIPEVISLKDDQERALKLIEDLKGLQTQGFDTIAVLCKTAVECENAYSLLNKMADDLPFHFITKDTLTFEKGISVIPSYLAKGVEFDAVLLYDASASNYHRESERKLFYTACTRAMHQLKLYTIGEPSRFITEVDSTTYTFV